MKPLTRLSLLGLAVAVLAASLWFDLRLLRAARAERRLEVERTLHFRDILRQIRFESARELLASASSEANVAAGGRANAPAGANHAPPAAKLNSLQIIASDRALRARYLDLFRKGIDVRDGLLFRTLDLSATDTARLRDLLAALQDHSLQVAETAADQGLSVEDPEMRALSRQLNTQVWADMASLLGPTGCATVKQFLGSGSLVSTIQDFVGNLPDPSISVGQASQLLGILAAASQRSTNGAVADNTVDIPLAVGLASTVLTPDQLLVLTATLQKGEAQARIRQIASKQ